jgi:hypothetical protein
MISLIKIHVPKTIIGILKRKLRSLMMKGQAAFMQRLSGVWLLKSLTVLLNGLIGTKLRKGRLVL